MIQMPAGSELLRVAEQPFDSGTIKAWFEVNPDNPKKELWDIKVFGTGIDWKDHEIQRYVNYHDSVLCCHGSSVWHVYSSHKPLGE